MHQVVVLPKHQVVGNLQSLGRIFFSDENRKKPWKLTMTGVRFFSPHWASHGYQLETHRFWLHFPKPGPFRPIGFCSNEKRQRLLGGLEFLGSPAFPLQIQQPIHSPKLEVTNSVGFWTQVSPGDHLSLGMIYTRTREVKIFYPIKTLERLNPPVRQNMAGAEFRRFWCFKFIFPKNSWRDTHIFLRILIGKLIEHQSEN